MGYVTQSQDAANSDVATCITCPTSTNYGITTIRCLLERGRATPKGFNTLTRSASANRGNRPRIVITERIRKSIDEGDTIGPEEA